MSTKLPNKRSHERSGRIWEQPCVKLQGLGLDRLNAMQFIPSHLPLYVLEIDRLTCNKGVIVPC